MDNKNYWNTLAENFNEYKHEYCRFMGNEDNIHNCEYCPENVTGKEHGCNQQNCWVAVHLAD